MYVAHCVDVQPTYYKCMCTRVLQGCPALGVIDFSIDFICDSIAIHWITSHYIDFVHVYV